MTEECRQLELQVLEASHRESGLISKAEALEEEAMAQEAIIKEKVNSSSDDGSGMINKECSTIVPWWWWCNRKQR